jgi:hypothetical protein
MYLDIAVYLKKYGEELDWTWIGKQLELTNMSSFAGTVFDFVKAYFRIDSPLAAEVPDPRKMEDIFEFTLDAGTFGFINRDRGAVSILHEQSESGSGGKVLTVLKKLFPPASKIKSRYTYLQKYPFLLPAAWIQRFIITGGVSDQHARDMESILSADRNEIKKLKSIYYHFSL